MKYRRPHASVLLVDVTGNSHMTMSTQLHPNPNLMMVTIVRVSTNTHRILHKADQKTTLRVLCLLLPHSHSQPQRPSTLQHTQTSRLTTLMVPFSNIERHANQHRSAPVTEKETASRNKNRTRNNIQNAFLAPSKKFFQTQRTPLPHRDNRIRARE